MIIKMLNKLRRMDEPSEKFNKKLKNIKTNLKNTITEIKNTLEGINGRLDDTGEWISEQEDRVVEITKLNWEKKKEF